MNRFFVIASVIVAMSIIYEGFCYSEQSQETRTVGIEYKLPQIPLIIGDNISRCRFISANMWNELSVKGDIFYDTTSLEKCFATYSAALSPLSIDESIAYTSNFASKISVSKAFSRHFLSYADRYLYHPNSPYRNEDCYIAFLEELLKRRAIEDASRTYTYVQRLTLLKQNRVGYMATNITMRGSSYEQYKLYDVKADYTLLLLYDPECETCKKVISYLAENAKVNQLITNKKLAVFAANPDGFSESWLQKNEAMPQSWIIGYDEERKIRANQLYDLKALPSLYLLDKKKMVLIKDGNVEEIVERLSRIS